MAFPLDAIYDNPTPTLTLNILRIPLHPPHLYFGTIKLRSINPSFPTILRATAGGIKTYDRR